MDVESRDYAPGETFSDHPSAKDINSDYVMEMDEVGDEGDTSESDEQEEVDDEGGQTDEESVDEDRDDNEENIEEEPDGDSNDSEQDCSEDSPKTTTSGERTEEGESANVSPVDAVPQKRGRGRPKKILHDSDILNALDESYHDKPKRVRKDIKYQSDEDEDSEEEEDEEDISEKKEETIDDNIRRSGRERKAPRKFEAVIPKKKKKKKRFSSGSEPPEEDEGDSDYSSKKKKRKPQKRDKFGIYKKVSPTKVKRKKQKKVISEDEDDQEGDTDSDNEYSRTWKNRMKKNKKKGTINPADYGGDKKSSRARNTTKYQEEETSHSSDVNTDYDVQEAEAAEDSDSAEDAEVSAPEVVFRCATMFQQQLLGLLYVVFLILVVVVLSFKSRGVRENYREAMYVGLTMGFTVAIWVIWIVAGLIVPASYQDVAAACGMIACTAITFVIMFMPKGRQLSAMGR